MPPSGGVTVEFRAEDGGELLWRAAMHHVPHSGAHVTWVSREGEDHTYKVERVDYVFDQPPATAAFDPPESIPEMCQHTPVAYVSEV